MIRYISICYSRCPLTPSLFQWYLRANKKILLILSWTLYASEIVPTGNGRVSSLNELILKLDHLHLHLTTGFLYWLMLTCENTNLYEIIELLKFTTYLCSQEKCNTEKVKCNWKLEICSKFYDAKVPCIRLRRGKETILLCALSLVIKFLPHKREL